MLQLLSYNFALISSIILDIFQLGYTNIYDYLDSKEIYDRFDRLRKEKHLSLYAVAKKGGISNEALYKWRDRLTTPSLYLLESISYALDITLVELLYDNAVILNNEEKEFYNLLKSLSPRKKLHLKNLIYTMIDDN